ncbi:phospholipase B-like [Nesidiocoris tenuis]|uniref:Phospholipase B-like n=1 Tax=Nesidiocoris tenuis TaxID=355587 RepID=A0ABN7AYH3_9HEMI|nr:phospholipase B-like [Nesidiocoris tenuis]
MLKVVGASLEQTRVTQFLLIVVIIIAIFAIFFYEATPRNDDGCYAATAYWGQKTGFRLEFWGQNNEPAQIRQQVARAYYKPHFKETGWASIEIQTDEKFDDAVQARAAGQLEGSLSWQLIWWQWQNTVGALCLRRENFCQETKRTLEENYKSVRATAVENEGQDPYWHQVNLYYIQLEGLFEGWELGKERSRKHGVESITFADLLWLNHVKDVRDLELILESETHPYNPKNPPTGLALLKYNPNTTSSFLLSHSTAGLYSESLRVMKRYDFGYHQTSSQKRPVPGRNLVFTSYPGAIHSQDDFYQIQGNQQLTVVGSRIKNYNPQSWAYLNLTTVFQGGRVMAANRLATDAKEWSSYLSRCNSGTGSNAWLAVAGGGGHPIDLWMVEQVPGVSNMRNMTTYWKEKGHLIVCGIPHSKEVWRQNGFLDKPFAKKAIEYVEPMIQTLREKIDDVDSLEALHSLMRDPLLVQKSRSDLQREIASAHLAEMKNNTEKRADPLDNSLDKENSVGIFQKPPLEGKSSQKIKDALVGLRKRSKKVHSGLIDLKIADDFSAFKGVAGPLYTEDAKKAIPPFSWSDIVDDATSNFHIGHPETWDFSLFQPTWVW